MKYLSVCSGIEAATVAWHPLGWEPAAFAEIEAFPAAVLAHHYPHVPNLGDMTTIKGEEYRGVDVLVGGTPCQAFSVAGLRQGLIDPRGSLTLTFAKLADDMEVPFVVWENVPGVLSSKDNAFGCFLGLLVGEDDALVAPGGKWTDAGYVLGPKRAVAWRVLDAQYFGLAQRRRRVFVVACPRDGSDPCEVLFEREGVRRDSPPSREKGEGVAHDVAPCVGASGRGFERAGETRGQDPVVACFGGNNTAGPIDVATARNASGTASGRMDFESETFAVQCVTGPITHALKADGFDGSEDGTGRGQPVIAFSATASQKFPTNSSDLDVYCTLERENQTAIAFAQNQLGEVREGAVVNTLNTNSNASGRNTPMVAHYQDSEFGCKEYDTAAIRAGRIPEHSMVMQTNMQVRRLTPVECERLQGFPRNYTRIPWRNKPAEDCPDGPRYKALGNSMAVPVMRWIGKRIQLTLNHI